MTNLRHSAVGDPCEAFASRKFFGSFQLEIPNE